MEYNDNRGSEWRKWDLHFHTPSSYDYEDRSITNEQIVTTLINNGISVVAITDHHTMDISRIKELQTLAQDKLTVLPGIEFLSDARGDKPIHFVGVFPEDADLAYIWGQLENNTNLIKMRRDKAHPNEVYCDLIDTAKLLKKLGGIVTIHAGRKNNGLEEITNSLPHAMAQKKDISDWVDIFEMGKERDLDEYREHVFPSIRRTVPMVMGSDNHNANNYTLKQNCWIKADPTFRGLQQIVYEPEERVKIQELSPEFDFEKSPFTEIEIKDRVTIFNDPSDNIYFKAGKVPLNDSLVSIIGGRGTGKSILIDYVARGFGKENTKDYLLSRNVSVHRKTSLREEPQEFVLADNPNVPFLYISQSQIKDLVSDKVKFTRVIRETIGVTDEYNSSLEYKEKADLLINEYFRIVKILEANNTDSITKKNAISAEIKKYNDFIANVTSAENKPKLEGYQKVVKQLESINFWLNRVNKLKDKVILDRDGVNAEIISINKDLGTDSEFAIPLLSVDNVLAHIENVLIPKIQVSKALAEKGINDTKATFEGFQGDLSTLLTNIGTYQNKVSELERERAGIVGEEAKFNDIKSSKLALLGNEIKRSIDEYTSHISNKWSNFKEGHEGMRAEMKALLDSILSKDGLNVVVNIRFDKERLYNLLLDKLDKRSYNIEKLEDSIKIQTLDDYFNFIKQEPEKTHIFSDSVSPHLRSFLLDLFYKRYTSFISHEIVVTSKGKPITKLSHGQQGTIFLRLQLASRAFSETIIYDQPEDDLDNDFIMKDLVDIFRRIKKYRQVIIVSHNANLVVNADSEQVIIAENIDGNLEYISGSLENHTINEKICAILEGGKQAFKSRERKYFYSN